VIDHLVDLFIEEWSTTINYSKYLNECAPSYCTYKIEDEIKFVNAITLLISLYGGLIIMLRLITPFLVNVCLKLKYRSRNINVNYGIS
jgi:hypothetical protein